MIFFGLYKWRPCKKKEQSLKDLGTSQSPRVLSYLPMGVRTPNQVLLFHRFDQPWEICVHVQVQPTAILFPPHNSHIRMRFLATFNRRGNRDPAQGGTQSAILDHRGSQRVPPCGEALKQGLSLLPWLPLLEFEVSTGTGHILRTQWRTRSASSLLLGATFQQRRQKHRAIRRWNSSLYLCWVLPRRSVRLQEGRGQLELVWPGGSRTTVWGRGIRPNSHDYHHLCWTQKVLHPVHFLVNTPLGVSVQLRKEHQTLGLSLRDRKSVV